MTGTNPGTPSSMIKYKYVVYLREMEVLDKQVRLISVELETLTLHEVPP